MTEDPKLAALQDDVARVRSRIAQQLKDDADHEVALAMFEADYRRAAAHLKAYEARLPVQSRTYVDGRRVA